MSLSKKIDEADKLGTVVRAMKTVAASNITQYEKSLQALVEYNRTVELGLGLCFRQRALETNPLLPEAKSKLSSPVGIIVFGSDQGLVGGFNDVVTDNMVKRMPKPISTAKIWAIGDRVQARIQAAGLASVGLIAVPDSIMKIISLVTQILNEIGQTPDHKEITELHLFYNRPTSGASYEPIHQRLLPLDTNWQHKMTLTAWPTRTLPQMVGTATTVLRAFIREYLFISLFRASAESLASENASRLAAMQRADKNIDDLLIHLNRTFHRVRQTSIDEELFDVIAGFEALR